MGRFLITTGVVVLLFVAYQLWGTGFQEAAAQNSLNDEFDEFLIDPTDAIDDAVVSTTTTSTAAPATTAPSGESSTTTTSTTTTVPFGPLPVHDDELAELIYRANGEAIARIIIPEIDVRKVVVEGVKVEDLRNGPGHYKSTRIPGHTGNSGIAGHRTTYGAPFNRIDELQPGDEINVRTVQGFFTYRVMAASEAFAPELIGKIDYRVPVDKAAGGHIIVEPAATWVLGDFGDDRLTLTACHPKLSAAQRIIVAAELVSEPVTASPPPPADYVAADSLVSEDVDESEATGELNTAEGDSAAVATDLEDDPPAPETANVVSDDLLDEGLNGEREALTPAILWGLAAIAVYVAFKELARRWRRWPSIALGIAPVVVLMALSFEKIDRFLPAG